MEGGGGKEANGEWGIHVLLRRVCTEEMSFID